MEGCTYVDSTKNITNYLDPINYNKIKKHADCINDSKLISVNNYYEKYNVAVFQCRNNNLIIEYSWTDFENSCSIMEVKEDLKISPGYTVKHLNSP
ncbi:hypothetical protein GCM10023206_12300 [Acinetobacter puyangensis]|uniref:Uncharacterized protein n=2 Tax=Acinetobacter puyangensis TaxID=1096779 RepID=A0A240E9P8_9GAMM|nr:hypothetical protein SAMN05421731_10510 [Acinetobacter puyangensis]